jgi:hypothetical protein
MNYEGQAFKHSPNYKYFKEVDWSQDKQLFIESPLQVRQLV